MFRLTSCMNAQERQHVRIIVVFVGSRPGIATHGRTATIEEAKAQFLRNWNLVNGKKE
jgi:hypothetical protein